MKGDLEKLQGIWNIVALELDGNKMPEGMLGESQIVVKGDAFDTFSMGAAYRGKVSLDENKSPKTFDLNFTEGPEKGNTNPGIYKLDGDTWTLCIATRGKERPKTFATKPGTGLALETLKRGKAVKGKASSKTKLRAKSSESKSADLADDPSLPPATGIHGEWAIVSGAQDGHSMEAFMIKTGKRVATSDELTVSFAGHVVVKAKYKTDDPGNPKTMDYVHTDGMYKGKAQAGICALEGRTLKVCFSAPGEKDRPSDFATKPGDRRTLSVWKLIKQ